MGVSGVGDLGGPVDRGSAVPMIAQIQQRLVQAVQSGALVPHQRIPSERDLSDHFGVSRLTVHHALTGLAAQGTVYTLRGRGTFVSDGKIKQPLRALTSFTQDVTARGQRPSSRVLEQGLVPAPLELAEVFSVPAGSELVRVRRLRLADSEPLAIETAHLVHAMCAGILSYDLSRHSLYALLREQFGLSLASGRQTIEADEPSEEERQLLRLPRGVPVLRTARITAGADGRVVEFVRAAYRGDRYQLTVELR